MRFARDQGEDTLLRLHQQAEILVDAKDDSFLSKQLNTVAFEVIVGTIVDDEFILGKRGVLQ